jgi:hypothetical protein
MNGVGNVLNKTAELAGRMSSWVKPEPTTGHPDYCSCFKPAGCWGNGGMHFREYGEIDVRRQVDKSIAGLPGDLTATDRERVASDVRKRYEAYNGLHIAYEQCQLFYDACLREIQARNDQQMRDGKGTRGMADGL